MSVLMNIATPNNQAVQNGNGIVASSSSISSSSSSKVNSSEFGSLIATLLGLTAPAQSNASAPIAGSEITAQNGSEKQEPTAISAISDLLKSLEAIEKNLKNGIPLNKDNVENALEAINALIAKLEISTANPVLNAAASMLSAQLQASNPLGLTVEKLSANNMGANTAQANALDVAKNLAPKDAISQLQQIAQKLDNIGGANQPSAIAELSQKLQQLTQKLGDVAPINIATKQANSGALNNVASSPINEETAKSLLSLLGANTETKANVKADGAPKLDNSALAFLNAQKAPINNQTNTANISVNQNITPNQTIATAAAASLAPLASGTIKTDSTGLNDSILLAQNIANSNANANFATNIKPATALYQGAAQNLNLPHVAFEFARNLNAGLNRFQIRMDPPEMGRIDVRIDIDNSGNLNARLSVERAETLDLLQRDVRALERALAQAGLDSNKTNLEFSLKDNPFERDNNQFANDNSHNEDNLNDKEQTSSEIISQIPNAIIYHSTASPGGINITA